MSVTVNSVGFENFYPENAFSAVYKLAAERGEDLLDSNSYQFVQEEIDNGEGDAFEKSFTSLSSRIELKDKLKIRAKIRAYAGEPGMWRVYKTLDRCNIGVRVGEDGVPMSVVKTCTSARCPVCAYKATKKAYFAAKDAVEVLYERGKNDPTSKDQFSFITLTIKHYGKNHYKEAKRLFGAFRKIKNGRWWRGVFGDKETSGTMWRAEVTVKGNYAHYHLHLLVKTSNAWAVTSLENELRCEWKRCGGGKVINVKRVEFQELNDNGELLTELIAYTVKQTEVSDDDYLDYIGANYNQPMTGFTGVFKTLAKESRAGERENDIKEIPPVPSPVNEHGEFAYLEPGNYSYPVLVKRAFTYGDWSARWCLEMIAWQQRYGNKVVNKERKEKAAENKEQRESLSAVLVPTTGTDHLCLAA